MSGSVSGCLKMTITRRGSDERGSVCYVLRTSLSTTSAKHRSAQWYRPASTVHYWALIRSSSRTSGGVHGNPMTAAQALNTSRCVSASEQSRVKNCTRELWWPSLAEAMMNSSA